MDELIHVIDPRLAARGYGLAPVDVMASVRAVFVAEGLDPDVGEAAVLLEEVARGLRRVRRRKRDADLERGPEPRTRHKEERAPEERAQEERARRRARRSPRRRARRDLGGVARALLSRTRDAAAFLEDLSGAEWLVAIAYLLSDGSALSLCLDTRDLVKLYDGSAGDATVQEACARVLLELYDCGVVGASLPESLRPMARRLPRASPLAFALRQRLSDTLQYDPQRDERAECDLTNLRILRMRGRDQAYVGECLRLAARAHDEGRSRVADTWLQEGRRMAASRGLELDTGVRAGIEHYAGLVALMRDPPGRARDCFTAAWTSAQRAPDGPIPSSAPAAALAHDARERGDVAAERAWLERTLVAGAREGSPRVIEFAWTRVRAWLRARGLRADDACYASLLECEAAAALGLDDALAYARALLNLAKEDEDEGALQRLCARVCSLVEAGAGELADAGSAYEVLAAFAERDERWDAWALYSERWVAASCTAGATELAAGRYHDLADAALEGGQNAIAVHFYARAADCAEGVGDVAWTYELYRTLAALERARGRGDAGARWDAQARALARRHEAEDLSRKTRSRPERARPGAAPRERGSTVSRAARASTRRDALSWLETSESALDRGALRFSSLPRIAEQLRALRPRLDDAALVLDALIERPRDAGSLPASALTLVLAKSPYGAILELATWLHALGRGSPQGSDAYAFFDAFRRPALAEVERFQQPAHAERWAQGAGASADGDAGVFARLCLGYIADDTMRALAGLLRGLAPGRAREQLRQMLLFAALYRGARGRPLEAALDWILDVDGFDRLADMGAGRFGFLRASGDEPPRFITERLPLLLALVDALPGERRAAAITRMLDSQNPLFTRALALLRADESPALLAHVFARLTDPTACVCQPERDWILEGLHKLGGAARPYVADALRRQPSPLLAHSLRRFQRGGRSRDESLADFIAALTSDAQALGSRRAYCLVVERGDAGRDRLGPRPFGVDELRWPRWATAHEDDRMRHLMTVGLERAGELRGWHPWLQPDGVRALALFSADPEPGAAASAPREVVIMPLDAAMLGLGAYGERLPGEDGFSYRSRRPLACQRAAPASTRPLRLVSARLPSGAPWPTWGDERPSATAEDARRMELALVFRHVDGLAYLEDAPVDERGRVLLELRRGRDGRARLLRRGGRVTLVVEPRDASS